MVVLSEERREGVTAMPVSDRATVGYGIGRALAGETVVIELSSTSRLLAVLEPLAEAASIAADSEFQVQLALTVPYGGEAGDRIDRPVLAALSAIPHLVVRCASGAREAEQMASSATRPTVVLVTRQGADLEPTSDAFRQLHHGDHVTLLAWGPGVPLALEAAAELAGEGIGARVVDVVTLAPLDRAALGAHVRATGRLVVVAQESAAADTLRQAALDGAFLYLESPPQSAAPSVDAIAQAARDAVYF